MAQCSGVVAGHGATIAIELDPVGAQGVFTTVNQLNGDISWGFNRPEEDVTGHQDDIDTYSLGVFSRDPLTFGINYIFDDPTHSFSTVNAEQGLGGKLRSNDCYGFRFRGPEGSEGVDEWLASGQTQAFVRNNPVRVGAQTADVTIRASGAMMFDGEVQD